MLVVEIKNFSGLLRSDRVLLARRVLVDSDALLLLLRDAHHLGVVVVGGGGRVRGSRLLDSSDTFLHLARLALFTVDRAPRVRSRRRRRLLLSGSAAELVIQLDLRLSGAARVRHRLTGWLLSGVLLVVDGAVAAHRGNPRWLIPTVVACVVQKIHARLRPTNREHLLGGRGTLTALDGLLRSGCFLVPLLEESEVVLVFSTGVLLRQLQHLVVFLIIDFHGANQRHRPNLRPPLTQHLTPVALLRRLNRVCLLAEVFVALVATHRVFYDHWACASIFDAELALRCVDRIGVLVESVEGVVVDRVIHKAIRGTRLITTRPCSVVDLGSARGETHRVLQLVKVDALGTHHHWFYMCVLVVVLDQFLLVIGQGVVVVAEAGRRVLLGTSKAGRCVSRCHRASSFLRVLVGARGAVIRWGQTAGKSKIVARLGAGRGPFARVYGLVRGDYACRLAVLGLIPRKIDPLVARIRDQLLL